MKIKKLFAGVILVEAFFCICSCGSTEVANLVGAKFNIPIHENDTNESKESDNFTPQGRLVLDYGQTIVLE